MIRTRLAITIAASVAVLLGGAALAQRGRDRDRDDRDREDLEDLDDRRGVPDWENDAKFKEDVFTFVRIAYGSNGYGDGFGRRGRRGRGGRGGDWQTDYPDSDLNFSFRLQQLTSLKVNPDPIWMALTDERLFDYPFIYIIEPGNLGFSEPEVEALRKYLLNGGFLMVDDFWGADAWDNFYREIKRVFPDREPIELPLEHEIFHNVYRLKEKPQIPAIEEAKRGRAWGITWEDHGPDSETPHYRAIFDDKGRMMVIICHNTDLGDGWEEEAEDEWYFSEFAEKKSYPMGINIVVYAMTH